MTKKTRKILIVEDEISLRNALSDKLLKERFLVIEAKNGEEGLEMALKEHPDLILLDIIMPKMDGMAMLKNLRGDSWGKTAKIIILTNLSENEKIAQAIEQNSHQYLIKSDWKLQDVVDRIRECLSK